MSLELPILYAFGTVGLIAGYFALRASFLAAKEEQRKSRLVNQPRDTQGRWKATKVQKPRIEVKFYGQLYGKKVISITEL